MKKGLLAAILLTLLCLQTTGFTVYEREISEMGYEEFAVSGANERDCTEIKFLFPQSADYENQENKPIASLELELLPIIGRNFYVEAVFNGKNLGEFYPTEFSCTESCWLRLALPKEEIETESNALNLCLNNSAEVTKSTLTSKTTIGTYKTVDFNSEDSFIEIASRKELRLGEKTEIKLLLHNKGSAASEVEMRHARPLAEDKNAYIVVDGNTQFKGIIGPGEKIEISYTIKPKVTGNISPPPAILYYKNVFGEKKQRFAKMETITVLEPKIEVNAFVLKDREINKSWETVNISIVAKNDGLNLVEGVKIIPEIPEGISIVEREAIEPMDIQPGETKQIHFAVSASKPGEYTIGCSIELQGLEETKCSETTVQFLENELPIKLIAGLGLATIAVAAYLYIQMGK